ncbi:MAG: phosphoribosylamine--glycine ligase, partial [Candidatus Taylorbacteria bacterium]
PLSTNERRRVQRWVALYIGLQFQYFVLVLNRTVTTAKNPKLTLNMKRNLKVLVIGSGGREHALVWKLAQDPGVTSLWCAPGNPGIARERLRNGKILKRINITPLEMEKLALFAEAFGINLTVVGPEIPLIGGITDLFESKKLPIFGPNQCAAQFEGSKVLAQKFMVRHKIPTPNAGWFHDAKVAARFASWLDNKCVVKADGLAAGKGALVCKNETESLGAIRAILVEKRFGAAGENIVIQELLEGEEISIHVLCDGNTFKILEGARDYKRALAGDQGLNTGGMGAYSPHPFLTLALIRVIENKIVIPWQEGCRKEGITFKGVLYIGIMLTKDGPKVLEFNVRFGDPEAQVILMRLKNSLVEVLLACVEGKLHEVNLEWSVKKAVSVVVASKGYPGTPEIGRRVYGLNVAEKYAKVFHAGTSREKGHIVTSGGRVLGITALADTFEGARRKAYKAVSAIGLEGMMYRSDIALDV